MAQIYKAQFGRGPTKVKTYFAGPDAIICILEDTQTPAEKRLVEQGESERIRNVRLFFQYAAEDELKARVRASQEAEADLRARGKATFAPIEARVNGRPLLPILGELPGPPVGEVATRPTFVARTARSRWPPAAGCPRAVSAGRRRQFRRRPAVVRGRGPASRGRGRTG